MNLRDWTWLDSIRQHTKINSDLSFIWWQEVRGKVEWPAPTQVFLYLCLRFHRCSYESTLSFTSAFAQEYFSATPKLKCWNIEKTLWQLLFLCFGAFIFHHSSCQTQNLGSRKVREQPSTKGSCFNAALQTLWQARKRETNPRIQTRRSVQLPAAAGGVPPSWLWYEQLNESGSFPWKTQSEVLLWASVWNKRMSPKRNKVGN